MDELQGNSSGKIIFLADFISVLNLTMTGAIHVFNSTSQNGILLRYTVVGLTGSLKCFAR